MWLKNPLRAPAVARSFGTGLVALRQRAGCAGGICRPFLMLSRGVQLQKVFAGLICYERLNIHRWSQIPSPDLASHSTETTLLGTAVVCM